MNKAIFIFGLCMLIFGAILTQQVEAYVIVSGYTFRASNFKNPKSMPSYFEVYPYGTFGLLLVVTGFAVVVIGSFMHAHTEETAMSEENPISENISHGLEHAVNQLKKKEKEKAKE